MTTVTNDEIAEYRVALTNYPEALAALDIIEECYGDLEDAASEILIEAGDEGLSRGTKSDFLKKLAENCRQIICQEDFKDAAVDSNLLGQVVVAVMTHLTVSGAFPEALGVAVVMYVFKRGIKYFCEESENNN